MSVFLVTVAVRVVIELGTFAHIDQVIRRVVFKLQYLATCDPILNQRPMLRCGCGER
jgi:hypothetical protein